MSGAILAVDVGSVRIGVAVAERLDLPAMPLTTVRHTNRRADVDAIVDLATERGAETVVVGYPLRLDGTAGPAAARIDAFVDELRSRFAGAVVTVDERLTTAAAAKKLRDLERSGGKRRALVDRLAAAEILESYLRSRRRDES